MRINSVSIRSERKALGHNGGIDGFVSNLAHFKE